MLKKEFPGESRYTYFLGITTLIAIFSIAIGFSIELEPLGILSTIIIISFTLFYMRKVIRHVKFNENSFEVNYLYGRKIEVPYCNVYQIYYNKEGFLPTHVYVIKFKSDDKKKKATFFADLEEMKILKLYLLEKGIKEKRFTLS